MPGLADKGTYEYSKLHPNVTFDVQAGGAGKGMTDMLTGVADIAMLSRDARQEELDQGSFATETINVYTRSDSAGAAEMWTLFSLGEAQEDLIGTAVAAPCR